MENKTLLAKDKLAKAFAQYLMQKETNLDDLTVGMVSSFAGINRITFYRNFVSMLDFMKWFLLKDLIFKVDQGTPLSFEEAFARLYAYIVHYRVAIPWKKLRSILIFIALMHGHLVIVPS